MAKWRLLAPEELRGQPCGGKAGSLLRLRELGLPVPPFLVLPTQAVAEWLAPLRERIAARIARANLDEPLQCADAAGEISAWIAAQPLHGAESLMAHCRAAFGGSYRCAVRSSASAEDGAKDSFAGQLETYLHVGEEDLVDRIRACIASLYGARALHYRHRRGAAVDGDGIAVIVQQMVPAARAGVLFSRNAGGNLNEIAVAAAYGMGEGVVADRADCDHYFIARDSRRIYRRLARKESRLDPDPERRWGLRVHPVAPERCTTAVLADAELLRLTDIALDLERGQHCPQDIEFAYDASGALFLLQARPITTLGNDPSRDWIILDNSNIVESYPNVTLPLTFDFARTAYRHVFTAAARAFGISATWIERNADLFENLLGYLNGRVYYRLDNARRATSQILTSVSSQRAWLDFLGLGNVPWPLRTPAAREKLRAAWRLLRLVASYRRNNRCLAARFQAELRDMRDFVDHVDDHESNAVWRFFEMRSAALFEAWAPTIVNDYFAMKTHDLLRRQLGALPGADATLANDLLCGIDELASKAPFLALLELKRHVARDDALRALFNRSPPEIAARIAHGDAPVDFRLLWDNYLREYGDRTLEELKLERPTLRQRPDLLASLVQNHLSDGIGADILQSRRSEIRDAAERALRLALRGRPFRRRVLLWLLERARQAVRDREEMRINRARAFGTVKEMFYALGRRMQAQGLLESAEDAYALRLSELQAFARDGDITDRRAVVAMRRRGAQAQAVYDMPDRLIFLKGLEPDLTHYARADGRGEELDGHVRRGLGVSRGVVEAPTLVLEAPELSQRVGGHILVTRMTDPGWVFLMTQAAGIVSEKGSLLSHTAIIGRELGIPTVVGVKDATTWLRDGAAVRLDGAAGTVEKLATEQTRQEAAQ